MRMEVYEAGMHRARPSNLERRAVGGSKRPAPAAQEKLDETGGGIRQWARRCGTVRALGERSCGTVCWRLAPGAAHPTGRQDEQALRPIHQGKSGCSRYSVLARVLIERRAELAFSILSSTWMIRLCMAALGRHLLIARTTSRKEAAHVRRQGLVPVWLLKCLDCPVSVQGPHGSLTGLAPFGRYLGPCTCVRMLAGVLRTAEGDMLLLVDGRSFRCRVAEFL